MTNSPNLDNEPDPNQPDPVEPTRDRKWRRFLLRAGLLVGGIALVGGAAGSWWAWMFIHERLAPLIEKNLSDTINRPVNLGAVSGVSFRGLQFGQSTIPATATDPDQVGVEAVEVGFNLLELAITRTLRLDITLVRPDIFLSQNDAGEWLETEIDTRDAEGPITTELDVIRVQEGRLVMAPSAIASAPSLDPEELQTIAPQVVFENVSANATFRDRAQNISFVLETQPANGGNLRLRGESALPTRQTNLIVQGQRLLAQDIGSLLPLPLTLEAGHLNASLEVQFRPDTPLALQGTTRFLDATAQIENVPNRFTNANGRLRFQGQEIAFEDFQTLYGLIPLQVGGSLHTQLGYALTGQVAAVSATNLLATFDVEPPVPLVGDLTADLQLTGAIEQPLLAGTVATVDSVRVDRLTFSSITTNFALTPAGMTFEQIRGLPAVGGLVTGDGSFSFGDQGGVVFDLEATNLPGDAIAQIYGLENDAITIGTVSANTQVFGPLGELQTLVAWQAPQATYPARGQVLIADEQIFFQDTLLQVAGGTVTGTGQASQGAWQATVEGSGIELAQFSPDLRGLFSGNLQLAGTLDDFSPEAIRAQGQVGFSEGIALVDRPITAAVRWTGDRIQIDQATAPGFEADGFILARLQGPDAPEITGLNLNVDLRDYLITDLPIPTPDAVQLAGVTNFSGLVTGTPDAPSVVGAVQVEGLTVNTLAFEPVLTGRIALVPQGLDLALTGAQDQVAITLDEQNRPVSFLVQRDEAIAQGRTVGDNLLATVENFPLSVFNLTPAAQVGLGAVTGQLSGSFNIDIANLDDPTVVGEVAIAQPSIGYIRADQFTGQFRYIDGVATLTDSELRIAESLYRIAGVYDPTTAPLFQGQVVAEAGRVQDILTALQIFDLQDLGRGLQPPVFATAAAVDPIPVGMPEAPLLTQLRRFSEILALREQQIIARQEATILPDLSELDGTFSGQIDLAFSPETGPELEFDLRGQDWVWDQYQVNQVIAEGSFAEGVLTLLPLRFETNESLLTFSGQIGGEEQSGQLQAVNIPIEALQDLFEFPVDVGGNLNATATLSGSIENPQVLGEVTLAQASLNGSDIQSARSVFGYNNARLNFEGGLLLEGPEPLRLVGSIPYQLPFAAVAPDSDQLFLDVNVRDEGLALINVLTNQVAYQEGEGRVNLQVRGTLSQPQAVGIATLDNAVFTAEALPEPLTNVTGEVRFNTDRIEVVRLQGDFSAGEVVAQGVIPIFAPTFPDPTVPETPLVVNLDQIALNLKGLYNGNVNGQVVVAGAAIAPQIGGEIQLTNGRIALPDGGSQAIAAPAPEATPPANDGFQTTPPEFNNLMITLGNNIQITREPILNFVASGDLTINGPLDNLSPSGVIRLRSGQVNIFTTQFVLERGYEHTAAFLPNQGLDPYLDVRLITSVPEVTRIPAQTTPSLFAAPEIADVPVTSFGAIQTVRIQAAVDGFASQLADNLELTSSPARSEIELIALLGGGFVDTLGRGDSTLALANLAGSALLTSLQNIVGNALGLTDFRLFPTTIVDENRVSTLGLAAEAGVNVTGDFSVSVLQILTADQPTQFNLLYRLNEEFRLRTGVDTAGNVRSVLEFETRF